MDAHGPEQFWLDDAEHRAYVEVDGQRREIVRATSAFKAVGLIDTTWFTEESRERGTLLHSSVESYFYGFVGAMPEHVLPYWRGFERFMDETGFEIMRVEEAIYDLTPGYEYGGKFDLFGQLPAPQWPADYFDLIDVKSGTMPVTTKWQTAGYGRRIPVSPYRLRRWALVLPGDGAYRLVPLNLTPDGRRVDTHTQRTHEADFLAIIRVANLKLGLCR